MLFYWPIAADVDYGDPMPSPIIFPVGETTACTNVTIFPDFIYEENENFSVSLSSESSNIAISNFATVIIQDINSE